MFVCLYFAKPQGGCIAAISLDDEHAVLFAMNKFRTRYHNSHFLSFLGILQAKKQQAPSAVAGRACLCVLTIFSLFSCFFFLLGVFQGFSFYLSILFVQAAVVAGRHAHDLAEAADKAL